MRLVRQTDAGTERLVYCQNTPGADELERYKSKLLHTKRQKTPHHVAGTVNIGDIMTVQSILMRLEWTMKIMKQRNPT
jgi:hypothetical protein